MPPAPHHPGDRYLSFPEIQAWCQDLAAARPDRVTLETVGHSRQGRPLLLLTLALPGAAPVADRPAFWLDGGTHASEWTGVMAALYSLSRWVRGLDEGDPELVDWFTHHAAHVLPCMSPDGYQALVEGAPFLRSSLRPPREDQLRVGLEPCDMDGDGQVRWMRWRHPAGPYVQDEEIPLMLRRRRLDDDPSAAFFACAEGRFLEWDGHAWVAAPLRHGLDLNRNFPGHWQPFQMFGMDGGTAPLSEPESRAASDAVAARPRIGAALTNHTYTGALLTQPYRDPSPLSTADVDLMEGMARDAVRDTGYRVIRVHPDFVYDPKQPIVGVWADTLSTVFGLPGYTLELWDPFAFAGVDNPRPAEFFRLPDEALVRGLLRRFTAELDGAAPASPWRPYDHPQLGPVELGGIDYLRTVRNPPLSLLPAECQRGFAVADRLRRALPRLDVTVQVQPLGGDLSALTVQVENRGHLPTSALPFAEARGLAAPVHLRLQPGPGVEPVSGAPAVELGHLDGWGSMRVAASRHAVYPGLPHRGHRGLARWVLRGAGTVQVRWEGGRAGRGQLEVALP
ncbi:M14 family metallopeptidase [Myxococcota bacterium]|nr:M14 family metallopeptidase [Myxococcota bacterium]